MTPLRWWALVVVVVVGALALAVRARRSGAGPLRSAGSTAIGVLVGVAALALVGGGYGAHVEQQGDPYCPIEPGGSTGTYGEFAWSAWPPGPTCTFTAVAHGRDEVRGPTPVMSLWLVTVAGGLVASFVLLRQDHNNPKWRG